LLARSIPLPMPPDSTSTTSAMNTAAYTRGAPEALMKPSKVPCRVAASVAGAALLVPGACPDVPGSSRGFVGVVRGDHAELVRSWSRGLAAAVGSTPTPSEVDAPVGRRTDLEVVVGVDAPCQPPRVRASLLTRSGVTVVLVRDVGVAGAIDDATAELVLASTQFR